MSDEKKIAVLDGNERLIGFRYGVPEEGDIVADPCDLPPDGTYKWHANRNCFLPLGHGFARPTTRPPINEAHVLYMLVKQLWKDAPGEVQEWCKWYEANFRAREEEGSARRRTRQAVRGP